MSDLLTDLLKMAKGLEDSLRNRTLCELIETGDSDHGALFLSDGHQKDQVIVVDKSKLAPNLPGKRFAVYAHPEVWQKVKEAAKAAS